MTTYAIIGLLAAAGVLLFFVPRRVLPALALLVLVLLPVGYMDVPRTLGRYFTPAVIIILVWVVRMALSKRDAPKENPRASVLLWLPILGAVAASALLGTSAATSVSWTLVTLICVVVPFLYGGTRTDDVWPSTQRAFLWIGAFLGMLAVVDFVAGFNPWTSLFSYDVTEKVWSVFRTRTSLGHPLVTSTVSVVCAMVALFGSDRRAWLRVACLAGSGAAVILAVSRTGVLAAAVGLALGCLVLLFGPSPSKRTRRISGFFLAVAAVAFLAVLTNSPLLAQRNDSSGGVKSVGYRDESTEVALGMIDENWWAGTGPGTSAAEFSAVYDGPLENSAFQLMLSLGVPLAVVAISAIGVVSLRVARRGDAGVPAAIVAFSISLVGFSAIDVNPAMLALLSPLMFRAGQIVNDPWRGGTDPKPRERRTTPAMLARGTARYRR